MTPLERHWARALALGVVGLGVGCRGAAKSTVDAGAVPSFSATGVVRVYPPAQTYLANHGQTVPSISGRVLTLTESYGAALHDPSAAIGDVELDGSGAFSFPAVPVEDANRLLAADLHDKGSTTGAGISPAYSVLYDAAILGEPPHTDLTGLKADLLPAAFVGALEGALSQAAIKAITGGASESLQAAGFVVGLVVDGSGNARPGAKVTPDDASLAKQLFYPTADFTQATQTATSASGLFVFVHTGTNTIPFGLTVDGDTSYLARNAQASPGMGLVVRFYPGTIEP